MTTPAFLVTLMDRPRLSPTMKKGPEDIICIDFANRLRVWTLEGRLRCVWTHPPHEAAGGTKFAAIRYALARALGMITGAPDYLFMAAAGSWAIEMKAPGGSMTENQKNFRSWCEMHSIPFAVCRSADEAEAKLREWGVLA